MAESKELKRLLMKVKEQSEKAGLKLNIQKTKIMASGPITSWQIDGETMKTVRDFSHVWMWELDYKESWVQKNWHFWTVVLEKMLESPLCHKEIKPVNPKGNQSWIFNTLAIWCKELTHWKRPRCWERLKAGGDGWMALPTWWTWVWASSGSWWQTGKPGMLQSMGSQTVGHNWVAELNWTEAQERRPRCSKLKMGKKSPGIMANICKSPLWLSW